MSPRFETTICKLKPALLTSLFLLVLVMFLTSYSLHLPHYSFSLLTHPFPLAETDVCHDINSLEELLSLVEIVLNTESGARNRLH